jgi:23S rRNA (adenine2030-N6)-methyltransferase
VRARFSQAVILWWRPLKDLSAADAADAALTAAGVPGYLRADLHVATGAAAGPLTASSMLIVRPPFGLQPALEGALPALAARLAQDDGARARVFAIGTV